MKGEVRPRPKQQLPVITHCPCELTCPLLITYISQMQHRNIFFLSAQQGRSPAMAMKSEALDFSLSSLIEESWLASLRLWKAAPSGHRHIFEDWRKQKKSMKGPAWSSVRNLNSAAFLIVPSKTEKTKPPSTGHPATKCQVETGD